MKNLSNFNLLIIILLFSSCRQQPFTGTVHIIPYPNQIAIGTQYIWGVIRSGFLRVGENEAKSVCL